MRPAAGADRSHPGIKILAYGATAPVLERDGYTHVAGPGTKLGLDYRVETVGKDGFEVTHLAQGRRQWIRYADLQPSIASADRASESQAPQQGDRSASASAPREIVETHPSGARVRLLVAPEGGAPAADAPAGESLGRSTYAAAHIEVHAQSGQPLPLLSELPDGVPVVAAADRGQGLVEATATGSAEIEVHRMAGDHTTPATAIARGINVRMVDAPSAHAAPGEQGVGPEVWVVQQADGAAPERPEGTRVRIVPAGASGG